MIGYTSTEMLLAWLDLEELSKSTPNNQDFGRAVRQYIKQHSAKTRIEYGGSWLHPRE